MKIGVNTLFLIPGEVGGTETYLRQTLRAVAAHHPGVTLVLFTNRENDAVLRDDLSDYRQVSFELLDFAAMNRYARIIREQVELPGRVRRAGVDVLWSAGYTAPFFCNCPQVVAVHDMQYKTFPQDMTLLARCVTDLLVNAAVRKCGRIITLSLFSRGEIVRHTGVAEEKICVTPAAANAGFGARLAEADHRAVLARLLPGARPYLLSVANTYPHKNIHTLVQAYGMLQRAIPHNLVIVGNPRLGEPAVQEALAGLPEPDRILRLRKLSVSDLTALYQGCDVFVFPSLYEGFGLPVLEAMLAGVPVVTMRKASIPEVGGDCVAYTDADDAGSLASAIKAVLGLAPDQRRLLCERAVERARTFSWQATAEGTVSACRTVLSNGG